ncbi:MAG: hypothetical protein DCF31_11415 [Alphaproteobacteria bacterium]|nr:MAG: hypothetical protein DCF31_11415 [Alphaproteobacteria bacterium]
MVAALRIYADAPFDLWVVDLSKKPQRDDIALLSVAECRRAGRFRFRRDRRRYIIAHAELRRLLTAHGAAFARDSAYLANDFGKPHVAGAAGPHFSLSYADDVALIGLSDAGAIGVDIETLRSIDDDDITSDIFDAGESAAISGTCSGPARNGAFLRAWTRKEAAIKAVGTGLSTPPASVGVGITDDIRQLLVVCSGVQTPVEVGSFRIGDQVAAWARVL